MSDRETIKANSMGTGVTVELYVDGIRAVASKPDGAVIVTAGSPERFFIEAKHAAAARLITQGKRWRAKHYQVFRQVEGPKLAMTCTKKGVVHMWACEQRQPKPNLIVEDWHKLDFKAAGAAIERLTAAGYDVLAVADELTAKMNAG